VAHEGAPVIRRHIEKNLEPKAALSFTDVAAGVTPPTESGLVVAIRTDARHATRSLQTFITAAFAETQQEIFQHPPLCFKAVLHQAYQEWGHSVLATMVHCLDFAHYGIDNAAPDKSVAVHFYNAHELAVDVVSKAKDFVAQDTGVQDHPVLFVSLDDMIEPNKQGRFWGEVGFSRLFSSDGVHQLGYVARPGKPSIEAQIDLVGKELFRLRDEHEMTPKIILVEDNVRHAKTINWVVERMRERDVFQYGELAAVATCFYMANPAERANMPLPIVNSVDYGSANVDVWTPRDLLFDGFVVEVAGSLGRLPPVFASVDSLQKNFKIHSAKMPDFLERVHAANAQFCHAIERQLGIELPISGFSGAGPIAHVTESLPQRPMKDLLSGLLRQPAKVLTA
jgi:hypothetical protein